MTGLALGRVQFAEGSLVSARDLRDESRQEAALRWLHVRALHAVWGVAVGFDVGIDVRDFVVVGPGVAFDCWGREIVSSRTVFLDPPLPKRHGWRIPGAFDLVVSYKDPLPRGDCTGPDVPGGEERPNWRWARVEEASRYPPLAEDVRLGEEIPLARYLSRPRRAPWIEFSFRRSARTGFRIAGGRQVGAAERGQLVWPNTWSVTVDTSPGRFRTVPFYFATVTSLDAQRPFGVALSALRSTAGPFISVRLPTAESFVMDLRLASPAATAPSDPGPLAVSWTGVEPLANDCPPATDPSRPYSAAGVPLRGVLDGRDV
jgi:hypothetical protein